MALNVEIGASTGGFNKGIGDAEKTLSDLGKRLRVITGNAELFGHTIDSDVNKIRAYRAAISDLLHKGVNPTSPEILNLADKVRILNDEIAAQPQAMGRMKRGFSDGQSAAISFNRVIQDAPYGIMGVSNNITQLAEQFAYLRKSSGSAGAAFKATFASLISPMNLMVLGISAITSAWTIYSMRSRTANSETKEFAETLSGLAKSSLEGEQSAQKQIIQLELLYAVTQDNTKSLKDRNAAADELQRMYPAYLGNLSNEAILTGQATAQYDKLRNAIVLVAQARAAEELLVSNRKRELEIARELADQAERNAKSVAESAAINKRAQQNQGPGNAGAGVQQQGINNAIASGVEKVRQLGEEYAKLTAQNNELVADVLQLPYGLEQTLEPADKLTDKITRMSDKIYKLRALAASVRIGAPEKTPDGGFQTDLNIGFPDITGIIPQTQANAMAIADEFNMALASTLESGLENSFGNIGVAIGDALASGGSVLDAAGAGLLSSMGAILVDLGKMAIGVGFGIEGVKKALESLNPFAAIAAGVALVALGTAFSKGARSLGNSMGGQGATGQEYTTGSVVQQSYEESKPMQTLVRNGDLMGMIDYGLKMRGR